MSLPRGRTPEVDAALRITSPKAEPGSGSGEFADGSRFAPSVSAAENGADPWTFPRML